MELITILGPLVNGQVHAVTDRLDSMQTAWALHRHSKTNNTVDIGFHQEPPPVGSVLDLDTHACPAFALGPKGCTVLDLAFWVTLEVRVVEVLSFFDRDMPGYKLRERQSSKVRIEVPSTDPM